MTQMSFLEILTLQLGAAIAKAILKLWLKDSVIALDATSSVVDIIKTKTEDVRARQAAKRQFEEIGEKAAQSLMPLFEVDLNDGSRTAVAMAVSETLSRSPIDPSLLVKRDLDPSDLAKFLKNSRPEATRDFSEAETELYNRLLEEISQDVVDIASRLPSFTERTLGEILRRETQLLSATNQVLQEIGRIRVSSRRMNATDASAARFESEYRRVVVRKFDEMELFGADLPSMSRRYPLSVAYVTLSMRQSPHPEMAALESHSKMEQERRIVATVDDALKEARYLLIRGQPGSGKTTLLQWIAVRSASETFKAELTDWNKSIPFFIRLREFAESQLPTPERLPSLVAPTIAETMPGDWVHNALRDGRALVLVDGVDELPESRRSEVREWIRELLVNFPDNHYIVTSRPHAVQEGWMGRERFVDAELLPMELPNIYAFIDNWHKAVSEQLQDDEQRERFLQLAGHLRTVVRRNRSIRNLATNPLLCAMLCAMHHVRRQNLPSDRIELYEACSHMLLEWLDRERHIELGDYPSLNYRQKRALLQDLAYWLLINGWSDVSIERADKRLALKLGSMTGLPENVTGASVRKFFIERTGMVREPVPGRLDFTHRTFQEFFAAQAALEVGDIGVLENNSNNDQWHDVIILAAGLATKKVREELITDLIVRGDKEPTHRLHLLAVACLETSIELDPSVKSEVEMRLATLTPKSDSDVSALAVAGELAVPCLARGLQNPKAAISCVRALAKIGTDNALEALIAHAGVAREDVVEELLRVFESFDMDEYERVLSQINDHTSRLRVSSINSLEPIQHLTNLVQLRIDNCRDITSLAPLAYLSNLVSLSLKESDKVGDLGPLAILHRLSSLELKSFSGISDLNVLANLTGLEELSIFGCSQVSDLAPLAHLTKLRSLDLTGCSKVSNLVPLKDLTGLVTLHLSGCESLISLEPLSNLTKLSWLDISFCEKLQDLMPLRRLHNLDYLEVLGLGRIAVPKEISTGIIHDDEEAKRILRTEHPYADSSDVFLEDSYFLNIRKEILQRIKAQKGMTER